MSLRTALATAARRVTRRPVLLVAGAVLAAADLAALFGAGFVLEAVGFERPLAFVWLLLLHAAGTLVLFPAVLPGLYAVARRDDGASTASDLGLLVSRARRDYRRLFGALLRARVVGVGLAVLLTPVVVGGLLVLATALSGLLYALGVVQTPNPGLLVALAIVGVPAVAWALGTLPLAFADLLALNGESPRTAWLASLRLAWARPRRALGYGLLRWGILISPLLGLLAVASVVDSFEGIGVVPFVGLVLVLATVPSALGVAFHAAFYDATLRPPTVPVVTASRLRDAVGRPAVTVTARTVLMGLLVVGLVASATAVRVADLRPHPEPGAPAAVDSSAPEELYPVALQRTRGVSRTLDLEATYYNATTGDRQGRFHSRLTVDFRDRQLAAAQHHTMAGDRQFGRTLYLEDGLLAETGDTYYVHDPPWPIGRSPWRDGQAVAAPAYWEFVRDTAHARLPGEETAWEVRKRGDGYVVLAAVDPAATLRSFRYGVPDPDRGAVRNESFVHVRLDTDSDRITKLTLRERFDVFVSATSSTVDRRIDTRLTATWRYDDTDVRRPADLGFRPWGTLWDLWYY